MQAVRVRGVANPMQFPDDMDIEDIKAFLQKRFANMAVSGESTVDVSPRQATAQAYKPSLQERFSQGVGNTLTSTGLVDDNYQAQNIGKNIGNIAAFTPVGSAFGGDEFGTALKEDDKVGMALGALEGVGVGGDIAKLAIFGGIMAKGADLKALAKAKKLETGGADRDEIWKETGWANDKGDWKFEISDYLDFDSGKGADINPSSFGMIKDYGGTTQQNFLGHPELYDSYPNLADRPVRSVAGSGGQYNYDIDTISMGENLLSPTSGKALDNTQSVNLHELQHAIQNREDFAGGGSPEQFLTSPRMKQLDKEIASMESSPSYDYDKIQELMRERTRLLTELPSPHEQYKRLAGEAEARNVQTRMNWTPEQRRATPPWKTLDVPEDELIYRKSGGKSLSANEALGGGKIAVSKSPFNLGGEVNDRLSIDGAHIDVVESEWSPTKFSIVEFLTDEKSRGQGKGGALLDEAISKYGDELSGAFSSKESLTAAYNRGFRPTSAEKKEKSLDQLVNGMAGGESVTMSFKGVNAAKPVGNITDLKELEDALLLAEGKFRDALDILQGEMPKASPDRKNQIKAQLRMIKKPVDAAKRNLDKARSGG